MHPIYYKAERELSQKPWYKKLVAFFAMLFIVSVIYAFSSIMFIETESLIGFLYPIAIFILWFFIKFILTRQYIKKHLGSLESSTTPSNIKFLGMRVKNTGKQIKSTGQIISENIFNIVIFFITSLISFYILLQAHYDFVELYQRGGKEFPGDLGDDIFIAGLSGVIAVLFQKKIFQPTTLLGKIGIAIIGIFAAVALSFYWMFGAYFGY